jgi:hypothetical protein
VKCVHNTFNHLVFEHLLCLSYVLISGHMITTRIVHFLSHKICRHHKNLLVFVYTEMVLMFSAMVIIQLEGHSMPNKRSS